MKEYSWGGVGGGVSSYREFIYMADGIVCVGDNEMEHELPNISWLDLMIFANLKHWY